MGACVGLVSGRSTLRRRIASGLLAGLVAPALLLSACGASKPAYCQKATELKGSVEALAHVDLAKEGIAGAEAAVHRVESSAKALVNAAKSEFPQQVESIEHSAEAFSESVKAAANPQTRASAVAQIPAEIAALATSTKYFVDTAKSKCE